MPKKRFLARDVLKARPVRNEPLDERVGESVDQLMKEIDDEMSLRNPRSFVPTKLLEYYPSGVFVDPYRRTLGGSGFTL